MSNDGLGWFTVGWATLGWAGEMGALDWGREWEAGLGESWSEMDDLDLSVVHKSVGVLILRRTLRHAIWVFIVEQGKLYPFVPAAHSWRHGPMHLGLIWGSVMHRGVFLPASLTQN